MNNKLLMAGIAILVLLGGGYFIASRRSTSPNPSPSSMPSPTSIGNSLKNLLMGGNSQSCTFSTTNEGSTSQGTVYVARGMVRGDFSMTNQGKTTMSHMIIDNKISYLWMDGQKTGFKTSFDTENTSSPSGNTNSSFDVNANLNYNCKPWVVDASVFKLPGGVEFVSMESIQQNLNIKTPSY